MTFSEQKTKKGYVYKVKDVFGEMEIHSPERLYDEESDDPTEQLDDVFVAIYQHHKNDTAPDIKGTVKDTDISYVYRKDRVGWEDTLDKPILDYVKKIFGKSKISNKRRHLLSIWYSEHGYQLTDELKNKIKLLYEQKN